MDVNFSRGVHVNSIQYHTLYCLSGKVYVKNRECFQKLYFVVLNSSRYAMLGSWSAF